MKRTFVNGDESIEMCFIFNCMLVKIYNELLKASLCPSRKEPISLERTAIFILPEIFIKDDVFVS